MADRTQAAENWVPRCPKCGGPPPILAPANGFTIGIAEKLEFACANCDWRGDVKDLKRIYVRM